MITKNKIGIYVHIPFCKKKCDYCDFISYCGKDDLIEKYVDSVKKEINHVKIKSEITTIYIGGGTPSYIDSKFIVQILEKIKENGVATLLITPYINRQITIESFTWGFKDDDKTGDIYYTIETKRYRKPTTSKGKGRPTKKTKTKTVTVKKGDTWAKLAKKYTGSSKNAKKIQKKNKMTNKKKPPVGKRIVIPV